MRQRRCWPGQNWVRRSKLQQKVNLEI